jgi:hypothetical protein
MVIKNKEVFKKIIADFNYGRGKCLPDIQKELLESGAGDISIYTLRKIVLTPEFRGVIINSYNGGQLSSQEAIDVLFPNCYLKYQTVRQWVFRNDAKRRSSFDPATLTQNLIITEPLIHRIKTMLLDSKTFFEPKQILVQLEKEDNRPYSRSVLDIVGRTLFFHHLVSPWSFHYFLEIVSEDRHKIGRCRDFDSRVSQYFTILFDKATIKLLLRYPTIHELKVDQWFKDTYLGYKIEMEDSNFSGKNKEAGEFYDSFVLHLFLDSEDFTIHLKDDNGEDFTLKLEKVLPGSALFESLGLNLKFLAKLRNINRGLARNATQSDIACEIHPDIANHPSLVGYRDYYRDAAYVKTGVGYKSVSRVLGLREKAVTAREAATDAREDDMRVREYYMDAREYYMEEREDDMLARESDLAARQDALGEPKDPSLK